MQIDDLENQVKKLKLEKTHLVSKIDDLENRGRRNNLNLIFHGVPEQAQGSGSREDVAFVLQEVLQNFDGLSASDYKIDRCHCTPTVPPIRPPGQASDQDLKPRMIHACFTSFSDKEKTEAPVFRSSKTKMPTFMERSCLYQKTSRKG